MKPGPGFAQRLLETKRPDFITVYLTGLDTEGAQVGTLQRVVQRRVGAPGCRRRNLKGGGRTHCAATGHGVRGIRPRLCRRRARCESLRRFFAKRGLFTADDANKILSWKAMPWPAGGTAAVLLADPGDAAVLAEVAALLDRLAHGSRQWNRADPGSR